MNLTGIGDWLARVGGEVEPGTGNQAYNWFGNMMRDNPEQFAIFADMLGRGFAPNNPFGGVGSAWGQSSLANKAAKARQGKQDELTELLIQALGGGLSPAGTPGPTQITIKPNKAQEGSTDKSSEVTMSMTGPVKKEQQSLRLSDIVASPF